MTRVYCATLVPANSRLVASSYVSLTSGTGLLRRGYLPAWTRVITVELDGRRLQTMTRDGAERPAILREVMGILNEILASLASS